MNRVYVVPRKARKPRESKHDVRARAAAWKRAHREDRR